MTCVDCSCLSNDTSRLLSTAVASSSYALRMSARCRWAHHIVVLHVNAHVSSAWDVLCSGLDAPMCSSFHPLYVSCAMFHMSFDVFVCYASPVQTAMLFSAGVTQLWMGFVCCAHVGGPNPGLPGRCWPG